eukprot:m.86653 g.86653  ORF g.86653 m.86653 type:complete len:195 (+) comp13063_c0_seq1:1308-1892(+)
MVCSQKGSLPWVMNNMWMQYRYSMNKTLLEEIVYPLLRQSTNAYINWMISGSDGKWHLPLSVSPEYGSCNDTNYDLSLFKWGLKTLIHIAEDLLPTNPPAPLLPKWKSVLSNLTEYPTDNLTGLLIGAGMQQTHGHRHWSNLFPIFPTYDLQNFIPFSGKIQQIVPLLTNLLIGGLTFTLEMGLLMLVLLYISH